MSHKSAALCCTHPHSRTDSPSPPPRYVANLDGIFAAAALPEDHPDAVTFPHRKPELDGSIVRSPGFGSKIKLQFSRRRSKMSLGAEKYDGDARVLTSAEMLHDADNEGEGAPTLSLRRFGSLSPITSEDMRGVEGMQGVGVGSPETIVADDTAGLAMIVATQQPGSESSNENRRPLLPLAKSFSAPAFWQDKPLLPLCPRRSRSESSLADILQQGHDERRHTTSPADSIVDNYQPSGIKTAIIPRLHIRGPTGEGILESMPIEEATELKEKTSDNALHLHKMGISQQLRCMSQLSDVVEDDSNAASPHPWTFHHRERSDLGTGGPALAKRPRHAWSSGVNSATVPFSWGRVRSPGLDTASSVYSRPTSAGASAYPSETPDLDNPIPPVDMHALFADWPLKPSASSSATAGVGDKRNKPLPPTPGASRKDSGTASFVKADNGAEAGSVRWLSPPQRAGSFLEKDDASIITKGSKTSKFRERFSPPKKTVKKRRSIFKFLRPGSRKQQARSVSTPMLVHCPRHSNPAQDCDLPKEARHLELPTYDGQSEDPALLTVQYELDERPSHATRSVSMIDFAAAANRDTSSQLPVPPALQRRPTLADYERNLTVIGDDRRRPSAINLTSAKEVHEDDHRDSVGLRRRISRARPLKDDASPLMAQALEKHQQEKALFRSASKQRESLKSSHTAPVFKSSPFSSLLPTPDARSELPDPFKKAHGSGIPARSLSSTHLAVPDMATSASSGKGSAAGPPAGSTRTTARGSGLSAPAPTKKRIGTSLETWSRYPSHNRAERCGSAGRPDNVITRDFAVDIDHADIQVTDDTEAASAEIKRTDKTKRSKMSLPKSRSMTFSRVMRYYSNLFSSTGVGQNRRTSVTMGGRLEYPELELLPPQLAAEPLVHPHHKHSGPFTRLREHAKEDAEKIRDFVREEEEIVEEYVKEEEDKVSTLLRHEEGLMEGFVKKEEGKLKQYVHAEEEKLKHVVQAEEERMKHHHWRHHSSEHDSNGAGGRESPFKEISLFEVPRDRSQESGKRRESMMIGPMDDDEAEEVAPTGKRSGASSDAGLKFDGAAGTDTATKHASVGASKAEVWSDLYRQCLVRSSSSNKLDSESGPEPSRATSMPPPALKPTKARSPEQSKRVDSSATIRRFPSVTVIDDRKGHFRSISLISVKAKRQIGFERESTHDLLELVQTREREEREKLLKGPQPVEQTKEVVAC